MNAQSLKRWAQNLIDEGHSLGPQLMKYAEAWEAQEKSLINTALDELTQLSQDMGMYDEI